MLWVWKSVCVCMKVVKLVDCARGVQKTEQNPGWSVTMVYVFGVFLFFCFVNRATQYTEKRKLKNHEISIGKLLQNDGDRLKEQETTYWALFLTLSIDF